MAYESVSEPTGGRLSLPAAHQLSRPPGWVADSVFYQVFPDRFARSGAATELPHLQPWDAPPTHFGFKGGDLIGIVEQLDWIEQLGCNALYLNPIFQSGSNHRYHTHDYFRVDPLLGGDESFDRLLSECRRRGIRVVLDGVFNHVGRGFYHFNHILEMGEESPFIDWFHIHGFPLRAYDQREGPAQYEAWWGMPALPKLDTQNPEVREYLMRVGEYWMDRGADGWRLDVPQEIATEGFWEEFRRRVRSRNPEAYLVGEIWDDASWWTASGERFDGTMNYLLCGHNVSFAGRHRIDREQAARLQYRVEELDAAGYAAAVQGLIDTYPAHVLRSHMNLLGSHDTARILTVMGGDVASVRLAALLTFTFPGAPCIYYGDEIGMVGGPDPDCRGSFPWERRSTWNEDILAAFSLPGSPETEKPCPATRQLRGHTCPTGTVSVRVPTRAPGRGTSHCRQPCRLCCTGRSSPSGKPAPGEAAVGLRRRGASPGWDRDPDTGPAGGGLGSPSTVRNSPRISLCHEGW